MRDAAEILLDGQWAGKSAWIIGGGASLKDFDFGFLKDKLSIGVNAAFKHDPTLAFFQDIRFFRQFTPRPEFKACPSIKIYHKAHPDREDLEAEGVYQTKSCLEKWGTSLSTGLVYVSNAGLAAINLADVLGASPIYLLGFDMKDDAAGDTHWHTDYPAHWKPKVRTYERFMQEFDRYARDVKGHVFNLNPSSALTCFEKIEFRDCAPKLAR